MLRDPDRPELAQRALRAGGSKSRILKRIVLASLAVGNGQWHAHHLSVPSDKGRISDFAPVEQLSSVLQPSRPEK